MATLVDGLGFEERVIGSVPAGSPANTYVTGSITADNQISGLAVYAQGTITGSTATFTGNISGVNLALTTNITAVSLSGTNVYAKTTIQGDNVYADNNIYQDYADQKGGIIIDNIPAEENISGGMWVIGSAASGTTVSPVAKIGSFYMGYPLGICLAYTTSGTASYPSILTRGFYKGLVAEGNCYAGELVGPGKGPACNCALTVGSSDVNAFNTRIPRRGIALMGGGSEATISVYLF